MTYPTERTRRAFLRDCGLLAGGMASGAPAIAAEAPDLIVTSGEDPKALVRRAIDELGGMKRFVSRGDVVVVKPNMAWKTGPATAANTNPDLVAALVEMAFDAGAKQVKVFDRTDRPPDACYKGSGIADAVSALGATVISQRDLQDVKVQVGGANLKEALIARDALECDCFINVPVAKHHQTTLLTMSLKNHMGISGDDHQKVWHSNIHQSLADFGLWFRPRLTVLDAYRILVRHGPGGGNVQDVQLVKKCIAGIDQAAVDAYGATLFGKKAADIPHLAIAGKIGVGEIDLAKIRVREVSA